jgi:cytoskeleton protein RodZ
MPLDSGAFAAESDAGRRETPRGRARSTLDPDKPVGEALKAARVGLNLTLDEISDTTRVRVRHLLAIEADDLDSLPSRPFTIGYVRAYAKALGADADATAARFRSQHPSPDDDLKPLGVAPERGPLNRLTVVFACLLGLAVLGWNIFRHDAAAPPKRPPPVAAPGAPQSATGPFAVDEPLPAPPEATAPAPYVTPVVSANAPANAVAPQTAPPAASSAPFTPQGTIYGSAAGASRLIILARNSISLEVRGPGGVVYFARQLAPGEAYRVPALPGLTAQVSNPESAELFENGVSKGLFAQPQIPLGAQG